MTLTGKHRSCAGTKKEQILLAAVEKFLENDYYQVTITEIAEAAAVGKGTVYEYFSSKEELFKESFSYCMDSYLQSFKDNLIPCSSIKQTFSNIVHTNLELLQDNRRKLHLIFNERPLNIKELQDWILKRREEMLRDITELLQEGINNGEVRPDIDPEMAARLYMALNYVVMGGMVVIEDVEVTTKQVRSVLDIYWHGIAAQQK